MAKISVTTRSEPALFGWSSGKRMPGTFWIAMRSIVRTSIRPMEPKKTARPDVLTMRASGSRLLRK